MLSGLLVIMSSSTEPVPVRQAPHRNHVHKQSEKTTRVRTVLNEKQLHTLRTCYNANPRPDALMKEQLVEMTGLSPRVIRVWFQNKRCKDKKRANLMKQLQQQQHSDKTVSASYSRSPTNTGNQVFFLPVANWVSKPKYARCACGVSF